MPAVTVAVPCRYIHAPTSILSLNDLEHTTRLLVAALHAWKGACDEDTDQALVETYGPSGQEGAVRAVLAGILRESVDETRVDTMGNLIAYKNGTGGGLRVMLAAHMDEIGLVVSHIDQKGYARFQTIGGVSPLTLIGAGCGSPTAPQASSAGSSGCKAR